MPLKKDLGQWISHFEKSDAPQFKGKSEKERKNMALAAYRQKYGTLNEAYENLTPNELAQYIMNLQDELRYYIQKGNKQREALVRRDLEEVKAELQRRRAARGVAEGQQQQQDAVDTITMDIPLFLRMLEFAREDATQDMDLHDVTEKANMLSKEKGSLTMQDYNTIVGAAKEIDEATDSPAETAAQAAEEKALILRKKAIEDKLATIKKGGLTEGREFDYEGGMARTQLYSIIKNAKSLFDQIDDRTQLQGWVQSKLTKAEDYIDAVRTYLEGESLSSTTPVMHGGEMMKDDEGTVLKVGDVVKAADGRIYQVIFSYSEGKPFLTPFDLKKRKPLNLRERHYFDTANESEMSPTVKMIKVMEYSATRGGFVK